MVKKNQLLIAVFTAIAISFPAAAFAEGEGIGMAVELTGGSLPQEIRDITGISSGTSSWDYLSQKISYGYFVEVYSHFDALARTKVDKRNGVEDLVLAAYRADGKANLAISDLKFSQDYTQRVMATEFAQRSGRGTQIANTYTMNTYLPHSDGSVEYFKDGLLARINNQRSVDEFGNVSFKNMYNFVYDKDRRLMLSHEYDRTDHMGNKTTGTFSCAYTGDSVFYGSDATNANKNYVSYAVTETDHTGRITSTTWTAGTYEGKYLRDFTQTDVDSKFGTRTLHRSNIQYSAPGAIISYDEDGVVNHIEGEEGSDVQYTYKLHRYDITYNGRNQISSYKEIRYEQPADIAQWTEDLSKWTKITSQVTIEYMDAPVQFGADVDPDPSRIKKQTMTSSIENPDGSFRNETATTAYDYDASGKLLGCTGTSTFTGLASDWILYTSSETGYQLDKSIKHDDQGNILKDDQGRIIYEYSYVDPETNNKIIVATAADETDSGFISLVTATQIKGSQYQGTSETAYEIQYGTPVVKESHTVTQYLGADNATITAVSDTTTSYTYGLVNNMLRLLETVETTVTTQPALDAANKYPTTKIMTTTYGYDASGYLASVEGKGTETGRDYSEDKGFANPYTSEIVVTYDIKLDKPLEKFVDETKTYDSTTAGSDTTPGDTTPGDTTPDPVIDFSSYTTSEALLTKAWEYYNVSDMANAKPFLQEIIRRHAAEAATQQSLLTGFADEADAAAQWALNDVGTAEYLLGQTYLKAGDTANARIHLTNVVNLYGYAQCWNPQGFFWHVIDAAQADLITIN